MKKLLGFGALIAIIVTVFIIIPISVLIVYGLISGLMWSVNSTPIGWLALVLAMVCFVIFINHSNRERKRRGW